MNEIETAINHLLASGVRPLSMTLKELDYNRLVFSLQQKQMIGDAASPVPIGMYGDFIIYNEIEIWKGEKEI